MSRDPMYSQGIFHHFDDANSHKASACIVGPCGTPYEKGFYLFDFTFPNSYPALPPRARFLSGDGRVRFNPNLYVDGKVCLSILGTWQGPGWTPLSTFRTTLVSIQSLLCAHPLQNEPGHEEDIGAACKLYSAILRYENIAVSVLQLEKPLPEICSPLQPMLCAVFLSNFDLYLNALREFASCEGCVDRCPIYWFKTYYSPMSVSIRLERLRNTLLENVSFSELEGFSEPTPITDHLAEPAAHMPEGDRCFGYCAAMMRRWGLLIFFMIFNLVILFFMSK